LKELAWCVGVDARRELRGGDCAARFALRDLRGAQLRGAQLRGAQLRGAQ
jgi:uncharacterized protein YjbI with pentapeptide repeats